MIILHRSQIQQQTTANLITAGVLKQDEVEFHYELLSAMTWEEVLAALLESHQLREECPNPIDYYLIYLIGEISLN